MSEKQMPQMIEHYNPEDQGSISTADFKKLGNEILAVLGNYEDNDTKKLLAKYVKYYKLCNDNYSYENSTIFDNLSTEVEKRLENAYDITLKLQILSKNTPENVHEVDFSQKPEHIEEVA